MCIHCCRLRRTPCPPIPYSCPHCPVRTISSCCPLGSRPFTENPFVRGRDREPPPDPCDTLPPHWLGVNRRVICTLANKLDRSPEAAHYILLRLLYANYGKVMMISRKRRSYRVPLSGFPDQDLFSASNLFDGNGYLSDPMAPETLGKLLHMLQDYIFRLRALNHKYKWFGNGDDLGEILPLLGEQDELVRLLKELFGASDVVSIPRLLGALNELEIDHLFGKWKKKAAPLLVRSISDLYSEVTEPRKPLSPANGGSKVGFLGPSQISVRRTPGSTNLKNSQNRTLNSLPVTSLNSNQMPTPITIIKPNSIANMESYGTKNARSVPSTSIGEGNPNPKCAKHVTIPSQTDSFDAKKSSTWLSRHPDLDRLTPDGRTTKGRVCHQKKLVSGRSTAHSEKTLGDADFGVLFDQKKSRRSTRLPTKALPSKQRKS
ncbi:uncharacterized protein LOC108036572 [Drosophila biarmipes]|uniref:uncharacterized protein LOC108036572 n=1 Tax=Drosophila biarmipes TaxID=125945 RepID=UPI0007E72C71|nr:uncharacterized protein LOC108036572 [Drosophila biarmipes]